MMVLRALHTILVGIPLKIKILLLIIHIGHKGKRRYNI